ncbi:MAG: inorganic diphosphatase [Pseudomonadota bacterium]|nr:inorganic diphosphatase [Pseudomonadota bacterium]
MDLARIAPGKEAPKAVNVVIEIPMGGAPVKYEVDKDSGALMVDRIMNTAMYYPCNYGYVPQTLALDGDPVDVLVVTPAPLIPGSVIKARPIGILAMTDESGEDHKVLAVPAPKIDGGLYEHVKTLNDLPAILLKQIAHFFEHYKDLETGKWVKVEDWLDGAAAEQAVLESMERFQRKAS